MDDLREQYARLRAMVLEPLAMRLEAHVTACFRGVPRIDRVGARAKGVDRFLGKAAKVLPDGRAKYSEPLAQIQDQIGARVVTFYLSDVEPVAEVIRRYFRPIETQDVVPDSVSEFGYFGKHFILLLPSDIYDDAVPPGSGPPFFELQVKTLFQHAWSEAEHDLGYKPTTKLGPNQIRRIAFTAAQAWGADLIFDELHRDLSSSSSTEAAGH